MPTETVAELTEDAGATLKDKIKLLKQDQNPRRTRRLINNAKKWKDTARSLQHAHTWSKKKQTNKTLNVVKALAAKCNLQRDRARSRIALLTEANDQVKKNIQELQLTALTDIPQLQTRGANNRFSDHMRSTVLQLQGSANVTVTQCACVIQTVAKNLFGVDICQHDLPCTQTAVNIADE